MSKELRIGLIIGGSLVVAGLLVAAGFALSGLVWGWPSSMLQGQTVWGPGMMGNTTGQDGWSGAFGRGMMGGTGGMMGGSAGVRGGFGGMMGGSSALGLEPLSLEQAEAAVEGYLQGLGNEDLRLGEIMIFDNHAYAQIVEASTGIGAMEVLVDPRSLTVYPEFGPNMMWNLKYGHMAGFGASAGMMGGFGFSGGMMGGWSINPVDLDPEAGMAVTPEDAVEAAQTYLDRVQNGLQADDHADRFYGYYTLHIEREGEVVGMLSVNGSSGQVFVHTWHGDFVEMTEAHADE